MKKLFFLFAVLATFTVRATVWTTIASGPVTNLANWSDGTSSPTSFATPGDTWRIAHIMTMAGSWSAPVSVWSVGSTSATPSIVEIITGGVLKLSNDTTIVIVNGDFSVNGGKVLRNGNTYYDSMEITRNFTLASDSFAIKGNSPEFRMNVGGNFLMSSGRFYFSATIGTQYINVGGNFTLSGGNFSQTGNTTTKNLDILGDFTMSADTFSFTGTVATLNLSVHGNAFAYGGVLKGGQLNMNVAGSMLNAGLITTDEQRLNCGDLTISGTTTCGQQTTNCHSLTINGGSIVSSGTGASMTYTVNGTATMTSASVTVTGTGPSAKMYIYGDCNITSGNYYLSATSGNFVINANGNFSLNGGLFQTAGNTANFIYNIYGNCGISGPAAITNGSAHGVNELHLALPSSSGTMLIHNNCSGAWTKTYVYVDTGCRAQLDGDFILPVVPTSSAPYGMGVNGALICPAIHTVQGTGAFTLYGLASLYVANAAGINGNITCSGNKVFDAHANYSFNGTSAQVTGSYLPTSLLLPGTTSIDNVAGVTLTQSLSTTGSVSLINGILHTGSNSLTTPGAPANVTGAGANSYIHGTLIKTIAGQTLVHYEVGNSSYTPMHLALDMPGTAGSIKVNCVSGLHPNVATSFILGSSLVNSYWSVSASGAAGPTHVIPSVDYSPGDFSGGSNSPFVTQKYTSAMWLSVPIVTANVSLPYSSSATGGVSLAALSGDYIFGEPCITPITGNSAVCSVSGTTLLSNATPGGTWSSSNPSVATISSMGVVTGFSPGSTVINYATSSCTASLLVTVGTAPITGSSWICPGGMDVLNSSTSGGVWTSSNVSIATISTTGVVLGVVAGLADISYTLGSCPPVVHPITVDAIAPITGVNTFYTGAANTLSCATPGGVWSSSNTLVATVSGSGIAYGVTAGTANISYTKGTCSEVFTVTILHRYNIITHSIIDPADTLCSTPRFYVKVNGASSLVRLKTYYGDGTNDSIALTSAGSTSSVYAQHAYTTPGVYTIKQIIYYNNMPHDSVTFNYTHVYCKTFSFKLYLDQNNDCILNSAESLGYVPVNIRVDSNGIPIAMLAATSGFYYKAKGGPGTVYAFTMLPGANIYPSCPSSGVHTMTVLATAGSYPTKYFAYNCTASPDHDLLVLPTMRCGTHAGIIDIIAKNTYCPPENATLTLNLTPKYHIGTGLSTTPPPSSVVGQTVTWSLNSLSVSTAPASLHVQLSTPTMLSIGDTVHNYYSITPIIGDINPVNNNIFMIDTLKGGFDPNYVAVSPQGCFEEDTQFQYTVHFENTGNDTAHNIYIMDTLGDYVDMSTLKILAATATMDAYVTTSGGFNVVKFDFPNIKLLDSSHHGLCDGAVVYTINRKMSMPGGAKLTNRAGIYFDINPVVMTNSVENLRGCPHPIGIADVNTPGATLFPNPTTHTLTIKTTQQEYTTYTITNSIGQTLIQRSTTGTQTIADVHMLPAGVYYVTLRGSGAPVTMKFVKM